MFLLSNQQAICFLLPPCHKQPLSHVLEEQWLGVVHLEKSLERSEIHFHLHNNSIHCN